MNKNGEMLHSIAPFHLKKFGVKERPNLQYHEKHSANIIKKNECAKFFVMNVDVVT